MIDLSSFIKVRCGTAAEWLTSTYKLGKAELGFDETNRFLKVGDGKTLWANLPVLGGNLGVTSFGGKQGDILLGSGLTMSGNTLKLISPDVTNFVEAYENNFNFNGKTVTFTVVNYTPPASGPSYYNWRVMFANGYRIEGYAGGGMSITAYNPYAGQSENIYEMSGGTLPKSYTFRDGQGDIGTNCIITGFYASNNGTDYIPITTEEFSEWIQITFENMKPSSAKTLNTSGSAGLTPSESESLGGTGVIYLHKISKTGSYNDLLNKPTIPTKTSQLTNDSNFATTSQVEAKYTKPSGGIPKTDLATAVQNSLTAADNAVKYTSQSLTDTQKSQARTNIGAGTSNFSGNYNDLTNKPTIPAAISIVQSTGTSTTSVMSQKATTDAISGKQDKITSTNKLAATLVSGLATVATSGSYSDLTNKPTIPVVNNGKLTLKAGSVTKTFTANQSTSITFEVTAASLGAVTQVKVNGVTKSPDSNGLVDLGTISGGSSDNSKFDYTVLTNQDLNTVTEAGRYRGGQGNTCANNPIFGNPMPAFFLTVETNGSGVVRQTAYIAERLANTYYQWYVRASDNNGSSWSKWLKQQSITEDYSQTFAGRKVFDNGIGIWGSLKFRDDAGSVGQFAVSQGSSSAPIWVDLRVKVNGTEYIPDSTGLIDLGTISGGTTTVMASTNLVY